jgi:ribosome-binding factor A
MPTEVKRSLRVSSRLARELAWVLARSVRDPRVTKVTITRVAMPDDLRMARIYVRLLEGGDDPDRRAEALLGLSRAAGMLRSESARRMGLRHAPELSFVYDDGQDHSTRIDQLLDEVKAEDFARGRSGS